MRREEHGSPVPGEDLWGEERSLRQAGTRQMREFLQLGAPGLLGRVLSLRGLHEALSGHFQYFYASHYPHICLILLKNKIKITFK